MTSFNLSEWALRHKSIVVYLMLAAAIAGLWAYGKLGREEDPPFTIKTMVVKTVWPGATATDVAEGIANPAFRDAMRQHVNKSHRGKRTERPSK